MSVITSYYKPDDSSLKLKYVSPAFRADASAYTLSKTPYSSKTLYLAACVVDGVTRDLPNGLLPSFGNIAKNPTQIISYYKNMARLREMAYDTARMFTLSGLSFETKIAAMNKIWANENEKFEPDYLGNNFYSATAAGVMIKDDYVTAFNIGNSNVMFVGKDGQLALPTMPDTYEKGSTVRAKQISEWCLNNGEKNSWGNPNLRAWFRQTFPNGTVPGSFTVFKGDENIQYNLRALPLEFLSSFGVKAIYIYTDGNIDILSSDSNRRDIFYGKYPYHISGRERTLLVIDIAEYKKLKQKVLTRV